jgi:Mitochondrial carrier protein
MSRPGAPVVNPSLPDSVARWWKWNGLTVGACVLSTSVAHTITAPLDRVKITLQTRAQVPWVHAATTTARGGATVVPRPLFSAIVGLWRAMVHEKGWSSLWRGNGIYVRARAAAAAVAAAPVCARVASPDAQPCAVPSHGPLHIDDAERAGTVAAVLH